MAFQFRKIILLFLIMSFSFGDCCCAGNINSTANKIKKYIRNQNLDIATKYIKKYKNNLDSIISSVKATNKILLKINSVEYNTSIENGILLKEKKQNSLFKKNLQLDVF